MNNREPVGFDSGDFRLNDRYFADLHIHSRFSRATSSDLTIPSLAKWAQLKGIGLLGTGDFTHPGWMKEIEESLVEDGTGLLVPTEAVVKSASQDVPAAARRDIRFILSVEISSIYKKAGRVRKVHSLVFMPSIRAAKSFSTALSRLGNITSDGRPILGLDPVAILKLAKDADSESFMIPAHIWTPHFSVFGAMSGFDCLEECFDDLAGEIFAVETGLSSDVPMNRRCSSLDRLALTSSSDAHSPSKLGREATVFSGEMSWAGLVGALRGVGGPTSLVGTVEFFPEEGKYHLDGHRKCRFRAEPGRTTESGGLCPVCGGKLTPGVYGRVEQLADRREDEIPKGFPGQQGFVPLAEIISDIKGCGSGSGKVQTAWESLIRRFGGELDILAYVDPAELEADGEFVVAEAIRRMRAGRVFKEAGYDGEYGRIGIFLPGEVDRIQGQGLMFGLGERKPSDVQAGGPAGSVSGGGCGLSPDLFGDVQECRLPADAPVGGTDSPDDAAGRAFQESEFADADPNRSLSDSSSVRTCRQDAASCGLTMQQYAAATSQARATLVVAGPGTGKTRTMVERAARLVAEGCESTRILVVTFTNRAAHEAAERLSARTGPERLPVVSTFHALALRIIGDSAAASGKTAPVVMDRVPDGVAVYPEGQAIDLDRLVPAACSQIENDRTAGPCFDHILVDEFQDISDDQYRLLELLGAKAVSVFCVGDPDQSIYGFRGAVPAVFRRFAADNPETARFTIDLTHRLTPSTVSVARSVISDRGSGSGALLKPVSAGGASAVLAAARFVSDESGWVATTIRRLVGGVDMLDAEHVRAGLGDIAVLGRTHQSLDPVAEALTDAGIPFERASDAPLWNHEWVRVVLDAASLADPMRPFQDVAAAAVAAAGHCVSDRQMKTLLELAASHECGPAVRRLSTMREVDAFGFDPEKVRLLTMHAAKGLEFQHVFVVGCNDGTVPLAWGSDFDEDEERRLFFVAVTRAIKRLYLSWAERGRGGIPKPSRFIDGSLHGLVKLSCAVPRERRPVQQSLL